MILRLFPIAMEKISPGHLIASRLRKKKKNRIEDLFTWSSVSIDRASLKSEMFPATANSSVEKIERDDRSLGQTPILDPAKAGVDG